MTATIHQLGTVPAADHLECPKCHATTELKCNCGVDYVHVSAGKRAEEAVKANPEKTDREIAREIGVGNKTVSRARKSVVSNDTTAKRTGKDGKKYKPTKLKKPADKPAKSSKQRQTDDKEAMIIALYDQGMKSYEIAKQVGLKDSRAARHVIDREKIRRAANPAISSAVTNATEGVFVKLDQADQLALIDIARQEGVDVAGLISRLVKQEIDANVPAHAKVGSPSHQPRGESLPARGNHPKYLSQEEVDPEFTGTHAEFVEMYGRVQTETALQYATARFTAWAQFVSSLEKYGRKMPELDKRYDLNWLREPEPRAVAKMTSAVAYLKPLMHDTEILLERATAALQKKKKPNA
jgi:hypothetical protein